jgi:hypothetical protein
VASKLNLTIDQGSDFATSFVVSDDNGNPLDLSTYTLASQIRKTYTSSTYYSINATANSSGIVVMRLNANTSNLIPAGRYVYDVELTSSSNAVSRAVEGIVTITPSVTR